MTSLKDFKLLLFVLVFVNVTIDKFQAQPKSDKADSTQDTLVLPGSLSREELEFLGRHDHRFHAPGSFWSPKHPSAVKSTESAYDHLKLMDQAWTVMLYKQKIISLDEAKVVLSGLKKLKEGGEGPLTKVLDGDQYYGSIPQLGRTLQEPMSRMAVREKQLDVMGTILSFLGTLQDVIELHTGTIMPGMTHMAHSQPITYGSYLLALHDEIMRELEYLELAYKHTNMNSSGCGATSGTGWPVDRYLVTELLGFDELLEPTYAGEASQEWAMSTLYALSNIVLTISRTAMDHEIWGMDGYNTHELSGGFLGLSSLMPQKAHSGSTWERVRMAGNNVLAANVLGGLGLHGEPYGDVLTSYQASHTTPTNGAVGALREVEKMIITTEELLRTLQVDKEKLLTLTREGWACIPDLAIKLIRDKGYASRQAHRICAVMVRIARAHRKIKPHELTGAMLDEAARVSNDPEPGLTTAEIQDIMDPVKFIERHNNTGDPNPSETTRMLKIRRDELSELRKQHMPRQEKITAAYHKLNKEIENIIAR